MKIVPYILVLTLVLQACKSAKDAVKTDIKIPTKFETAKSKIAIDSSLQKQAMALPSWKSYYKDPLLQKLIDSAIIQNFDAQIAYQRIMQARAGVQFTKGIRLPELGLNLGAGVRRFGDYTIDGVGNYDTQFSPNLNDKQRLPNPVPDYLVGVYSSWEVDLWGKLKSKKKAALSRYLASEQGRNLMLNQLVSDVAIAYFNIQLLDKELSIIEENIGLQENALEVVKIQKESGKETELAIQLMSAQVLDAKNMYQEVLMQMLEQENQLNMLLGRYPERIERSEFEYEEIFSQDFSTGVPSDLLINRPDIQASFYELKATNADVHAAKVAFYPSLNINSNLGFQAFRAALLFEAPSSIAYNIAGGLVSPLLNRRALKAELMSSKASQKEAYVNFEKSIFTAFSEVYEIVQKTKFLDEMSSLKTNQVSELEKSITTSKLLFSSGRASYLEIIASQENYLKAQLELLQLFNLKKQNRILLFKAVGGGWK